MPIRLSGIASGLDTDSIVQELVDAYNIKVDDYKKDQTKLEWKMDAWKDLNTKIYDLYSSDLRDMRYTDAYTKKKTTASDETAASITATKNVQNGTQDLKISSLAKTSFLTGGELGAGVTANTKLSDLGISVNDMEGLLFNVNVTTNGTAKSNTILLYSNDTVKSLVEKLNKTGLTASFDETNHRFFIGSKESGKDNNFSIQGMTPDSDTALSKLGLLSADSMSGLAAFDALPKDADGIIYPADITNPATESLAKAFNKYVEDTYDFNLKSYQNFYKQAGERIDKVLTDLGYGKVGETDEDGNLTGPATYEDALSFIEGKLTDATAQRAADTSALASKLNAFGITKQVQDTNPDGSPKVDADGNPVYTNAPFEADDMIGYVNHFNINSSEYSGLTEDEKTELKGLVSAVKDSIKQVDSLTIAKSEVNVNLTERSSYADLMTADQTDLTGQEKAEILKSVSKRIENAAVLQGEIAADVAAGSTKTAVKIEGKDASIVLNGATFASSTNVFNINGLTINAKKETGAESITINTDTDYEAVYDKIKGFITKYNALINEMDSLYNADAAKGYEPLTDDEKEAMTDSQIEKWEKKVKDSLLRRDGTLSSVSSAMKNSMLKTYTYNGKKYSLSSFGINTLSYFSSKTNEKNAYHIDGDSEDSAVSANDNKLKEAIMNDPDSVMNFFTRLTQDFYDTMTDKMKSTTLSSTYTVYNDKQMKEEYNDYDDLIKKWQDKAEREADKYYKQFAAMEKALSQLQSSTNALTSMLG